MNTHVHATHSRTRTAATSGHATVHTLRVAVRRLATWWNDDAVTAHFAAARERDQRLLHRINR